MDLRSIRVAGGETVSVSLGSNDSTESAPLPSALDRLSRQSPVPLGRKVSAESRDNLGFPRKISVCAESLAEREGFEPSVPVTQYARLAIWCLRPLGHLSGGRCARINIVTRRPPASQPLPIGPHEFSCVIWRISVISYPSPSYADVCTTARVRAVVRG
jgi:hypothetical protein